MSGHHETTTAVEPEPHLPPPSLSPPLIGLGVTVMSFGILFGVVLIAMGVAILLIGIITWLIDDARTYVAAGESGGHGGH